MGRGLFATITFILTFLSLQTFRSERAIYDLQNRVKVLEMMETARPIN